MSNIVLNTKTYNGSGLAAGIASYIERSGGVPSSFSALTGSVRVDTKARVTWKLQVPTVATEASACACPGDVMESDDFTISIRMGMRSTDVTRADLLQRLQDLVASSQFEASITNLEQPGG